MQATCCMYMYNHASLPKNGHGHAPSVTFIATNQALHSPWIFDKIHTYNYVKACSDYWPYSAFKIKIVT